MQVTKEYLLRAQPRVRSVRFIKNTDYYVLVLDSPMSRNYADQYRLTENDLLELVQLGIRAKAVNEGDYGYTTRS